MSCTTAFVPGLQVDCLIEITKKIIAKQFDMQVAKYIVWTAGCVMEGFTPVPTPLPDVIGAAVPAPTTFDSIEECAGELYDRLVALKEQGIQSFNASPKIDPQTWELLKQLFMLALPYLLELLKKKPA